MAQLHQKIISSPNLDMSRRTIHKIMTDKKMLEKIIPIAIIFYQTIMDKGYDPIQTQTSM